MDQNTAQTQVVLYSCVACKSATGPADRMLNLALEGRKIEQVVLCRACGRDAREFGHEVYRLEATLAMIARRQAERTAAEAARQAAAKAFFGKMGGNAQPAEEDSSAQQAAAKARRAEKRDRRDFRSEEWESRRNGAAHGYLVTVG